ncbi:MAG TPA: Mut7-C RNAse domain-containing protein [Longimicrobiaceae bacterium]|nr:Mut7-C RNAse domain-containing protein [Longimicrobiaceae bacterium]
MPTLPCPGCGRPYPDDGRFALGRTLICACGTRMGRRVETGAAAADPPRFLADSMLGGLARWLRVLGYDAAWEAEIADAELVRRGAGEGRWILTRDRALAEEWWTEGLLRVRSDDPLEQLREVAGVVPLSERGIFSRCTRCNLPLEGAPAEAVAARVPVPVRAEQPELRGCPGCGRVYWEGSHTARMRRIVARALAPAAPQAPPGEHPSCDPPPESGAPEPPGPSPLRPGEHG